MFKCRKLPAARAVMQRLRNNRHTSSTAGRSEDELKAAREWLSRLTPSNIISSKSCEVSYSRSSGPGGQNVNKVNSKATLRIPLENLLPRVPPILHQSLRDSRYFALKTNSLLLQADESRKQASNEETCFVKLHEEILASAARVLPGETSAEQVAKVKRLEKIGNERRIREKKVHSSKKAGRRSSSDG